MRNRIIVIISINYKIIIANIYKIRIILIIVIVIMQEEQNLK